MVIAELAPHAQTQQPEKTIVIHARKFAFSPSEITLKKGETVKLVLISDDVRHGLAVRGLGIRSEIKPGRKTELIVTPTEVGDFPGSLLDILRQWPPGHGVYGPCGGVNLRSGQGFDSTLESSTL